MRWKLIGLVIFAVLVTIFTLVNSSIVAVNFLFVKTEVNLVLVILLSLLLGMILMAILWSIYAWKMHGDMQKLKAELSTLENGSITKDATMNNGD